jgi:hypothetical protein
MARCTVFLVLLALALGETKFTAQLNAANFSASITGSNHVVVRFHRPKTNATEEWVTLAKELVAKRTELFSDVNSRGGVLLGEMSYHQSSNPEMGHDGLGHTMLAELEVENDSKEEEIFKSYLPEGSPLPQVVLIERSTLHPLIYNSDVVGLGLWLKRHTGASVPLPGTWHFGERQARFFLHNGPYLRQIKMAAVKRKMDPTKTYKGDNQTLIDEIAAETAIRTSYYDIMERIMAEDGHRPTAAVAQSLLEEEASLEALLKDNGAALSEAGGEEVVTKRLNRLAGFLSGFRNGEQLYKNGFGPCSCATKTPCFFDLTCDKIELPEGSGCNAEGKHYGLCRHCGFGTYKPCNHKTPMLAAVEKLASSFLDVGQAVTVGMSKVLAVNDPSKESYGYHGWYGKEPEIIRDLLDDKHPKLSARIQESAKQLLAITNSIEKLTSTLPNSHTTCKDYPATISSRVAYVRGTMNTILDAVAKVKTDTQFNLHPNAQHALDMSKALQAGVDTVGSLGYMCEGSAVSVSP